MTLLLSIWQTFMPFIMVSDLLIRSYWGGNIVLPFASTAPSKLSVLLKENSDIPSTNGYALQVPTGK